MNSKSQDTSRLTGSGKRRQLLCAALLWWPLVAVAASPPPTTWCLYRLAADIGMLVEDPAHAEDYRASAARMIALIDSRLAGATAETAAHWRELRDVALAEIAAGAQKAVSAETYDTAEHWSFVSGLQNLRAEIEPQDASLPRGNARLALAMDIVRATSVYVQVATDPVGGYNRSVNQKDSDLPAAVRRIDAGFAALRQNAGASRDGRIATAATKWQFIRSAIERSGSGATPWIVYRVGFQAADLLAGEDAAASAH